MDDAGEVVFTFQDSEIDPAPSFELKYRVGDDGPEVYADFTSLSTLNNALGSELQLEWHHDGNTPFIIATDTSVTPSFVSSNPPEDWMHQTYERIQCLTLRQLCVPGSHDSGMSEFNQGAGLAVAADTVTQTMNIYDQLVNGARWFDIRPVIAGGHWATGHYSYSTDLWHGGNGQYMDAIIDEINQYTSTHQELLILDLSHGLNTDIFEGDENNHLTQDDWNDLMNYLLSINNRVTGMSDVSDLSQLLVSSFIESSPAVLIIIRDTTAEGTDVDLGDFADQGFFTSDQYPLYNSYANSDDQDDIESDQFDKMHSIRTSADSEPFLLSWTITEDVGDIIGTIIGDSIVGFAEDFNDRIYPDLWPQLSSDTYPNVLAVDAFPYQARQMPALAMAINYHFAPTCTAAAVSPTSSVPSATSSQPPFPITANSTVPASPTGR